MCNFRKETAKMFLLIPNRYNSTDFVRAHYHKIVYRHYSKLTVFKNIFSLITSNMTETERLIRIKQSTLTQQIHSGEEHIPHKYFH